jgi:hypothetical protein
MNEGCSQQKSQYGKRTEIDLSEPIYPRVLHQYTPLTKRILDGQPGLDMQSRVQGPRSS